MTDEIEDPTGVWSGWSSSNPTEAEADEAADHGHVAANESTRPEGPAGSDPAAIVEGLRRRFEDASKDLEANDRMGDFEIQDTD